MPFSEHVRRDVQLVGVPGCVQTLRVAHRFLYAAAVVPLRVRGPEREGYVDTVWQMYEFIYRPIGMSVKSPRGLLEYPIWDLMLYDGEPVAFTLFKEKPFGLKAGLSGHDGSPQGKAAALQTLRTKYKKQGIYGEVSHKVKDIVLAAGAPVVCAAYASMVLRKPTEMDEEDPLSYSRFLKGVGMVKKTLVGQPRGIPVTDPNNPVCPAEAVVPPPEVQPPAARVAQQEDVDDLDAHLAEEALMASLGF